jgi:FkbM family methyltransferase
MNTRRLFLSLLRFSGCRTVCDVGSMDGSESLAFASAVPGATVIALEANRENYDAMSRDPRLATASVQVMHLAASDRSGEAAFHVADVDYSSGTANRGESSLLTGYTNTKRTERVRTVSLDALLANANPPIALWIDVEGAAHQVVLGMRRIAEKVCLVHVELDLVPYWPQEVPGAETLALLESLGMRSGARKFYPDGPGAPGWQQQLEQSARRADLFPELVPEASGNVVLTSVRFYEEHRRAVEQALLIAKLRAAAARLFRR